MTSIRFKIRNVFKVDVHVVPHRRQRSHPRKCRPPNRSGIRIGDRRLKPEQSGQFAAPLRQENNFFEVELLRRADRNVSRLRQEHVGSVIGTGKR